MLRFASCVAARASVRLAVGRPFPSVALRPAAKTPFKLYTSDAKRREDILEKVRLLGGRD